jgi:hypothetical protein
MTDETRTLIFEAASRARIKHPHFAESDHEKLCLLLEECGEVIVTTLDIPMQLKPKEPTIDAMPEEPN